MKTTLPKYVKKYFWGDNLRELSFSAHKKYITKTLLEKGDENSLKWLFNKVGRFEIRKMLPKISLSEKSANFWSRYFS